MPALAIAAALAAALVGGLFFAFSNFVMAALGELRADAGIAAMQAINRRVLNLWFFGVFFGTALAAAVLAASSGVDEGASGYAIAGVGAYLVGCIGVTMLGNVPLNRALARLDPADAAAGEAWRRYRTAWLRWNHLRTAASLLAALLLLAPLM